MPAYFFRKIASFANINLLKTVHYAMAQSIMQYCMTAWGCAYETYIDPLYVSQKHLLKIISKNPPMFPTALLFKELNIFNLESLWKLEILKCSIKTKKTLMTMKLSENMKPER